MIDGGPHHPEVGPIQLRGISTISEFNRVHRAWRLVGAEFEPDQRAERPALGAEIIDGEAVSATSFCFVKCAICLLHEDIRLHCFGTG